MDESEMSQRNENSRVMAGGLRQKMLRKHGGNGKNWWDKPESRPDWKTLEEGGPLVTCIAAILRAIILKQSSGNLARILQQSESILESNIEGDCLQCLE
jgi:hypothetical protein